LLAKLYNFVRGLFARKPVRLAIVRRYMDANGSYVGELYMDTGTRLGYAMVGVSLDSLPFVYGSVNSVNGCYSAGDMLDTANDFLAFMPPMTIRVGALHPEDNDNVRRMVAKLSRRNMTLTIQNRFVENVLEPRKT
jgi:hypothetical protein